MGIGFDCGEQLILEGLVEGDVSAGGLRPFINDGLHLFDVDSGLTRM